MRIVFLGTPDFAVPVLRALAGRFDVAGVVTQPDRLAGRGRRLRPSAVRVAAQALGLPVHPSAAVSSPETLEHVRSWDPQLIVVAAFGQILRRPLLGLPPHGCLNLHASLLPRWRGASPVQFAILHGDVRTGVTVMQMDPGLDTGPILAQREVEVRSDHTGDSLSSELALTAAELIVETIPRWVAGEITPAPQDDSQATYAPLLRREDGRLDPTDSAENLARRVRAFTTRPGTFLEWDGQRLVIRAAQAAPGAEVKSEPGRLIEQHGIPALVTGSDLLLLTQVQMPGRRPVDGAAFLRGNPGFARGQVRTPARST